jgi:hypothetical protein
MLRRLVKEPLTHFLALALMIFVVYAVFYPSETQRTDRIVVTDSSIQQLASLFARAWQRPPSTSELKELIDDYVKEEIYYREALTLGLDKDDTIIRRRLRLKMEFLSNAEAEAAIPTDMELDAYLKANPGKFEIEPMMAFRQVYLSPERRGDKIDQDATAILAGLLTNAAMDPDTLGDATLLPSDLLMTGKMSIVQMFGREFADALDKATTGQWTGPVKSAFGLHIVRVTERKTGRIPTLGEVRDIVVREWSIEKRKAIEEARFNQLLQRYQVRIESPSQAGAGR